MKKQEMKVQVPRDPRQLAYPGMKADGGCDPTGNTETPYLPGDEKARDGGTQVPRILREPIFPGTGQFVVTV